MSEPLNNLDKYEIGYGVFRKNSPFVDLAISPIYKHRKSAEAVADRINKVVSTDEQAIATLLQQQDPMVFVKEHKVCFFMRQNGEEDSVVLDAVEKVNG